MRLARRFALCALLCAGLAAGCQTTGAKGPNSPVYLIRVEKGDTLASIAAKYDTSWDKIAELNGFKDGSALKVGRVIRVRPGPGGIVAGAEPAPPGAVARAGAPRGGKRPAAPVPRGDAADAEEFTEDDVPDDAKGGDATGRRGLLFGGGKGQEGAALRWPLQGELSSLYGKRGRRMHRGIDVRAPRGTTVNAAGSGVVEFAGRKRGYGKTVIIKHGDVRTLYAHLDSIETRSGARVSHGTVIGSVGATGNASGPHLHFEIRTEDDATIDPLTVLEAEKLVSLVR